MPIQSRILHHSIVSNRAKAIWTVCRISKCLFSDFKSASPVRNSPTESMSVFSLTGFEDMARARSALKLDYWLITLIIHL